MSNIDLTLAVNYIPACSCTMRLLAFLLWLSILAVYDDHRYYVILGIVLYLDRIIHRNMTIFDSNAVICTVYFANIYQHLRRSSDDVHFAVLLVYFVWSVFSCFFQWNQGILLKWLKVIPFQSHIVEAHFTSVVVLYLLYHTAQVEPYGWVIGKSITYNLVVIAWVYIVGLRRPSSNMNAKCIVRFLPILVLPIWMSVLFTVVSVGILIYHFKQSFHNNNTLQATINKPVVNNSNTMNVLPKNTPVIQEETASEMEDIEAMFRLAKQSTNK